MKGDNISERLLDFAVGILQLVQALPKTAAGRHVGSQLFRSSTSAGANYEEARGAESKATLFTNWRFVGRKQESRVTGFGCSIDLVW
jgi:four helix bundle protein